MFQPSVSFSGLPSVMKGLIYKGVFLLVSLLPLFSLHAQTNLVQLRSFGVTAFSGAQPQGRLLSGSDGFLYGTTPFGGSNGFGTIFRIGRDGKDLSILKQLSFTNSGATPYAGLIEGKDGFLYGTTFSGGARGFGTLFKVSKDGLDYSLLKSFGTSFGDGTYPKAGLVESFNGFLYGTTTQGGNFGLGTVFRVSRDGSNYAVIRHFQGGKNDGDTPNSALVEGPNLEGFLYGTTYSGGSNEVGTVYRINTNGSIFKVLLSPSLDPGSPELIEGGVIVSKADGLLYGCSRYGGTNDVGTIFRLDRTGGGFSIIRHFALFNDAKYPGSELLEASDGLLYGVTPEGGTNANSGTVFRMNRTTGDYSVVKHFGAFSGDGIEPRAGLIEITNVLFGVTTRGGLSGDGALVRLSRDGSNSATLFGFSSAGGDGFTLDQTVLAQPGGNLFGVTRDGGSDGGGTVYRIDRRGTNYTVLRNFGPGATNLLNPAGPLIDGLDGYLYGTALFGGANNLGGVYRIGTNGAGFQILRSFTSLPGDGRQSSGSLLLGSDGALYGTTRLGGGSSTGMVFRLTRDGNEFLPIHDFVNNASDGAGPRNGVVESGGFLYGVAPYGGSSDWGVVFRVGTFGEGYQVLHHFGATATDGLDPSGGLLKASDGRLFGVTRVGGANGLGTVFRYDPSNSVYTVLIAITNSATQGYQPVGRLVEGADGLLYGAMSAGGSFSVGTLYRLAKDGSGFTTLYHFGIPGEGRVPVAGLAVDGTSLFGTTFAGGEANLGTIFQFIAPPPAPTIVAHPLSAITAPGQSVLLSVSATASGPVLFQWQRNGVEIPGATASNLLLASIGFTNGGSYRVVVSSAGGSLTSTNSALVVFTANRSGNTPQLQIAGPSGRQLMVQSKTDLQSATLWQTFSNVVMQGSLQMVTDPESGVRSERYFRAVLP
jgi:uncharacterized repeat protein (TIGR03803 family)